MTRSRRYEHALREAGVLDDATVDRIGRGAAARVEEAIAFAKQSPLPDPSDAASYVFA